MRDIKSLIDKLKTDEGKLSVTAEAVWRGLLTDPENRMKAITYFEGVPNLDAIGDIRQQSGEYEAAAEAYLKHEERTHDSNDFIHKLLKFASHGDIGSLRKTSLADSYRKEALQTPVEERGIKLLESERLGDLPLAREYARILGDMELADVYERVMNEVIRVPIKRLGTQ